MQLASIVPPLSGHCKCYMRITVTIPGAETHIIVRSQDAIHKQPYEVKAEPNYLSNHEEITITIPIHDYTATEPRWQSTMDMMKKPLTEQRVFKRER